ncbi:MAG: DUF1294 domain-containing protein [Clostridia bacterium]|nr:DUF1294 domain-containing protein [Clostridia bacterium]NCC42848.1 DUF1294 domain-containing protein [Clostridia bacterium]
MKFLMIYLLLINFVGMAAFGIDKYKAVHKKWRIRESVLFLFAFLGGGIGCLAGMYLFRHKTKHRIFTIGIPVILVIELILGCAAYLYFDKKAPYQQDPKKLVQHELSLLKTQDSDTLEKYISYQDVFPSEVTDKTIPDDIESIFFNFFKSFSYKITDVTENDDTAQVSVSLTTLNGQELAREYSKQTLIKQIQISANPTNVDYSLEDCYLLLGTILNDNTLETETNEYTISLSCKDKIWSIDSPTDLESALTGNFAYYVSDVNLFSPSEIVSIHLDTLKNFDSEQLNRYLALDSLFSGDEEYKRKISKALASQLLTALDYTITSENLSSDRTTATVETELTSCDCHTMMSQYQAKVMEYTNTAQALQDGISGRLTKANDLLIESITDNTATITTPVTIHLENDGSNWKLEMSDEMSEALLGNISEAVNEVSQQLASE